MDNRFKKFTASDGVELEYLDQGQGPVLLNIHPYGSSTEMQVPLLDLLKDDFRTITFSQRGWGGSPLEGEISLFQSARDARDLLDYLDIDQAYFVGLSMGAAVTFAYVSLFGSDRMEKAFIMDMTPKLVNTDDFKYGLYQGWYQDQHYQEDLDLIGRDPAAFNKYFYQQALFQHRPEEVRTFEFDQSYMEKFKVLADMVDISVEEFILPDSSLAPTLQAYWRAMGEADFREDLKKFSCPVLLAYASPGSIYYEKTGEYVKERIPDSRLVLFEDNTHVSFMLENLPDQVALIKSFYREG